MELVVRFALQELAAASRPQHLLEALAPVTARQQQKKSKEFCRRRRDVGVVLVHADAKVGILECGIEFDGAFERQLDALAIARG